MFHLSRIRAYRHTPLRLSFPSRRLFQPKIKKGTISKKQKNPWSTRVFCAVVFMLQRWWRQLESNQWPLACQASTLTSWAMPPFKQGVWYHIALALSIENRKIFRNIYSFVQDARRIKKEYRKTVEPRDLYKPKAVLIPTALKVPGRFRFQASDPLHTSMRT